MKLASLLLFAAACLAQPSQTVTTWFSNPAGVSCQSGSGAIYATTGALFTCQSGIFVAVTSGGTVPTFPLTPTNGGVGGMINVPPHLRFLGDGSDGAINCSGNLNGVKFATTFNVSVGNTCTANSAAQALTVYATGACTIAGTLNARGQDGGVSTTGMLGATGGGGGGGAAAGIVGSASGIYPPTTTVFGGTAGVLSGGVGGAGSTPNVQSQRYGWTFASGNFTGGSKGGAGGSSGGAGGNGGQSLILVCASVSVAATGVIDVTGAAGGNSTGNSIGAGGGGGGGVIWLVGRDSVVNLGTLTMNGGAGGSCGAFTPCGAGGAGGAGWSKTAVMQ
jgi:hypothetical protein